MKKFLLILTFLFLSPVISHAQVCGSNWNVQFNDSGNCGANNNFNYDTFRSQLFLQNDGLNAVILASSSSNALNIEGTTVMGAAINVFGDAIPFNTSVTALNVEKAFAPTGANKTYYSIFSAVPIVGNQNIAEVNAGFFSIFTDPVHSPGYSGTVSKANNLTSYFQWNGGTVTEASGFRIKSPVIYSGTVSDFTGLTVEDIPGSTGRYAIKTGLGPVLLGDRTVAPFFVAASTSARTYIQGEFNHSKSYSPASTTPCLMGDQTWDKAYIYICIHNNDWRRSPLSAY